MERPFLSLSHLQTVIVLLGWFYKSFPQMCLIVRIIHGKESNKYSKMQVSNTLLEEATLEGEKKKKRIKLEL